MLINTLFLFIATKLPILTTFIVKYIVDASECGILGYRNDPIKLLHLSAAQQLEHHPTCFSIPQLDIHENNLNHLKYIKFRPSDLHPTSSSVHVCIILI